MIDFLHGLGQRYLSLGYSTPFLSLGGSYMYSSLAAAKAAVISVGEEISTMGLPSKICPLVFVFTGSGNVSQGAQEIFKLLPHKFVDPGRLPELFDAANDSKKVGRTSKRVFQVYGCVVTSKYMVEHKDPSNVFDKADYYAHPDNYRSVFHEKIAPYTSVIVNCMYWEKRFPRLLTITQLQDLMKGKCSLVGIADITCDIGGSIEFIKQTTSIDLPFFRYDPHDNSYHHEMDGNGIICSAVDILPTEFAREASQHFGDILSQFIGILASSNSFDDLPAHLKRACIVHGGSLTSLYEYIPRMRKSLEDSSQAQPSLQLAKKKHSTLISLSGHLFDQFLINEALDIIEAAGGSFQLIKCQVGQSTDAMSYSELEVGADDKAVLDAITDSLTSLANPREGESKDNRVSFKVGKFRETDNMEENGVKREAVVLILGAGRVCRPAAEFLSSIGRSSSSKNWLNSYMIDGSKERTLFRVIVASLFLKDAEEIIEGIPNTTAVQLDISNEEKLCNYISQVDVVISLLPASCHSTIANACIQFGKNLVTASYVDNSMSKLDESAKRAGITILCEMGLDPGIDHMMAMKMINQAHARGGKIKSFTSYCGGLPAPAAANNPLAYKFSWSPAGAIRAGRNPATYKQNGDILHVDGDKLYDSASRIRIPDLPAFALECLPNRDSLVYGDLYGIQNEASTVFRGTLRYEGFGEIMGTLAKIGFFNTEESSIFKSEAKPTFRAFLLELLQHSGKNLEDPVVSEKFIADQIVACGLCTDRDRALKTAKTILFLGFHEKEEVPVSCKSAFDIACMRMEERLSYSGQEQDMVLLHHEVEVEFPNGMPSENHRATLLEFGRSIEDRQYTAMALTVGIPVAIGALLLLGKNLRSKGVLRPIDPEVYVPGLDILEAYGFKLLEKMD
ncbi:alpha-aminoadipic semialdehyde synthase isoform X2 [Andrographis paniculata]|nr:alpha-aminoadipic semialdehyde synthase isoform X2 [Andrographis paniculata]